MQGSVVHQGIAVYGNKGSTDQHAYVQQLREGVPNFFATFIEVLRHRDGDGPEVDEDGMNSGDYLHGFFLGTRDALYEKERKSITLTIKEVNPASVGALIALFERAVGLYASLVGINAYHQPGWKPAKKAAASVFEVRKAVRDHLLGKKGEVMTAEQVAQATGFSDKAGGIQDFGKPVRQSTGKFRAGPGRNTSGNGLPGPLIQNVRRFLGERLSGGWLGLKVAWPQEPPAPRS